MKRIFSPHFLQQPLIALHFLIVFFYSSLILAAQEPLLTIQLKNETRSYKRSELLKRKDLEKLELTDSPTYPGKKISFSAIPLIHLFGTIHLTHDSTVLFRCQDGFSAPISPQRLLNSAENRSVAYLAVEDPRHPWPKIKIGAALSSPGPFYLIWKNSKASEIKTEEWPFQVTHFEIKPSLRASYPELYPQRDFGAEHPVMRGLKVFTQNCFTCHTLNRQGDSHLGPDLNTPHNPTEYFHEEYLRKFIRNPQSVRHWQEDRMQGFKPSDLSEEDLNHLITYLKEMTYHRPPPLNKASALPENMRPGN